MSKKYILQESPYGNWAVLGTYACAVIDEEDVVAKSGKDKLISFSEYEPAFVESDFENCYLEIKETFLRLLDLCNKDQKIEFFVCDSLNQEQKWISLSSPDFPGWTFLLLSAMVKKYDLKVGEDGSILLYVKKIEKNRAFQVSPEGLDGKTISGSTIMSHDEIIESLKGKELEAVDVRVCEVSAKFIIVSYQGQTYKVNSDELYFEESDRRKDTSEYKKHIGEDIPMFPLVSSEKLRFSEIHIRYTEDRSILLPDDIKVGDELTGVPVGYRIGLGIFVLLDYGRVALLHVSDLAGILWKQMRKEFPLGKRMTFKLKKVDGDRIGVEPVDLELLLPPIFRKSSREELFESTEDGICDEIIEGQIVDVLIKYVEKVSEGFRCYVSCERHRGVLIQKAASHEFWRHVVFVAKQGAPLPAVAHIHNGTYEFCIEEAGQKTCMMYEKSQLTKCMQSMLILGYNKNKLLLRFGNSIGILSKYYELFDSVLVGKTVQVFLDHISKDGSLVVLPKREEFVSVEVGKFDGVQDEEYNVNVLLDKVKGIDFDVAEGKSVEVTILGSHGIVPVFTISGFVGTFAKSELESMDVKLQKGDKVRVSFTGQFQPHNNRLLFRLEELLSRAETKAEVVKTEAIRKPTTDTPCKGARCVGIIKSNDIGGIVVNVYQQNFVLTWKSLRLCEEIIAIDGIMQILFPKNRQIQLIVTRVDNVTGQPSFMLYYPEGRALDMYKIICVTETSSIVRGEQGIGIVKKQDWHSKDKWVSLARTGYDENWMPVLCTKTDSYLSELIGMTVSGSIMSVQSSGISIAPLFPYHEMGLKLWMPKEEWDFNEAYPVEFLSYQGVPITIQIIGIDKESKTLIVSQRALVENKTPIKLDSIGELRYVTVSGQSNNGYLLSSGEFVGLLPWKACGQIGLEKLMETNVRNKRKAFVDKGEIIGVLIMDVDVANKQFSAALSNVSLENWKEWAASVNPGDIQDWKVCRVSRKFVFIRNGVLLYALSVFDINRINKCYASNSLYAGQTIKVRVVECDAEQGILILMPVAFDKKVVQFSRPEIGEIVEADVAEVLNDNSLKLDGHGWMGLVNPGDIVWGILKKGTCAYKKGDRVRCRAMEWQEELNLMICSIRDLLPKPEEEAKKDCVYKFIVNNMDKTNIFLTSPNGFSAVLPRKEEGLDKPLSAESGTYIHAMVQGIDYNKHVLVLSRKPMINFVLHSQKIDCVVKSVSSSSLVLGYKGLYSTLKTSDISDTSLNLAGMYKEGDIVRAMVIKYDWESGKIKLSIKAANSACVIRKNPINVGDKIQAKILIVEPDKLIIQWKENYGCISKKDALAQDILLMKELYSKNQIVDCVVTSVKGKGDNYFTATTNPSFSKNIKNARIQQGVEYNVTIIRQEKDCLIVGYGEIRGSIPNKDLYWGEPYAFDNEKYQAGKELSVICNKIIPQKRIVLFSYDKGMNDAELTHVVSIENSSVIVEYQGTSYRLDSGHCPVWFFSENDDIEVKPVLHKQTYKIRIQNDRTLLPGIGEKVIVDVFLKRAEGLVVKLPNGIKGYIPKEELGWFSAECDINGYNLLQIIKDIVLISIDEATSIPCLSRRATIEDPMAGYEIGMKVNMRITKVSESLIIGVADAKNAIVEKQNAGWKFQFGFSEDLTTVFKVGDQFETTVLVVDRDNALLSLGMDIVKPKNEDFSLGRFYNVEIVTDKPNGIERIGDCYLVKWGGYYGFMPYSEADYQTLPMELQYRPGEEVTACIYGHDEETGLPFMSHRRMIKWNPISKDNLALEVGDIVKAFVIDSSDLGILIKLKDYDLRSFVELRQLYSTRQEMSEHPYLKGDEIDVVVNNHTDKKLNFRIPDFVGSPMPIGETSCKVTVLSKAGTGYNVYTESGMLAWLPAIQVDFKSMVCKITNTSEQKIEIGQQLRGIMSHEQGRKYATFKVADIDVAIATSVSNFDVTDVDNIRLEVEGVRLRGCVNQGSPLTYFDKQKIESLLYQFHTNFGKIEIPDGLKMKVKYQERTKNGTIVVSIIELLDET